MNSLVSVLMCVYNTPVGYLREAVDSILYQNYKNIEFIIVDDGSNNPDTIDYLTSIDINSSSTRIIHNDINLGLTRSLNIGLKHCRGKYIARMDSDDISLPDRVGRQVDYLDMHPDVVLVGCGIESFGERIDSKELFDPNGSSDNLELYRVRSLLEHSGPPHPTFMFRTKFLKDNGIRYREDILKAQDYGIMVDILRVGGIIRKLNEPLLKYRVHKGQISMKSEIEQKAYQCRVSFDYISEEFPWLSEPERACISTLGCHCSVMEMLSIIEKNKNLHDACYYLVRNRKYLCIPRTYISAIKKIIKFNDIYNKFDACELESEFRYRWWKKALRTSKEMRRPWGMSLFTVMSHRYVR